MCVRTILVYGLLMFSRKPRLIYALKRLLASPFMLDSYKLFYLFSFDPLWIPS